MNSEPDILQRERIKMMPVEFQSIYKHVAYQLEEFNKVSQTKVLTPQNNAQASAIQKKITASLSQTEECAAAKYHGCETVSNWMNILQIEQESFEGNPQDSDGLVSNENTVILTYRGNAVELKALESEVQEYLRRLINSKETPLTIRLDKYLADSKSNLATRQDMLKRLTKQIEKQDSLFKSASAEGKQLNDESERLNTMLTSYRSSENYGIIQKAKKLKIMIEDWSNRKADLANKINESKSELENYQSLEKANSNLTKADLKNTDSLNKLKVQFEEMIRAVNEESAIEDSRNTTMMAVIQKDLGGIRNTLLSRERKQTSSEMSKCKSTFDRLMNRIKKQTASMKKQTEKSLKSSSKEGPSEEQCSNVLDKEHEKDSNYWGEIFNDQKKEFQDILDTHLTNLNNEKEAALKKIVDENANKYAILLSKKERLTISNSERQIEYESVHDRIESTEGILNDLIEQLHEKTEGESDLKNANASAKGRTDSVTFEIRQRIEKMQKFIDGATIIRDECKRMLKELMKKAADYQKVQILPRSKSYNNIIDMLNKKKQKIEEEEEEEANINEENIQIEEEEKAENVEEENFEEDNYEEDEVEGVDFVYEFEEREIENEEMLKDAMQLVDGGKYSIIEKDGKKFLRIRYRRKITEPPLFDSSIVESKIDESGNVTFTDTDGEEKTIAADESNIFVDDDGNKLMISENGKIIILGDKSKLNTNDTMVFKKPDGTVLMIDTDGKVSIVDPEGNQTIFAKNGTKTVFNPDGSKVVTEQSGKVITVDVDGNKTITDTDGSTTTIDSKTGKKTVVDAQGVTIITEKSGKKTIINLDGSKTITDTTGKQITVDAQGNKTLIRPTGSKINILDQIKDIRMDDKAKLAVLDSEEEPTIVEKSGTKTIIENNQEITVVDSLSSEAVVSSDGDTTVIETNDGVKTVVGNKGTKTVIDPDGNQIEIDEKINQIKIENGTKTLVDKEGNVTTVSNINNKIPAYNELQPEEAKLMVSESSEDLFSEEETNQVYVDKKGAPVAFNAQSKDKTSISHVKFVDTDENQIKLDPSGIMVIHEKSGKKKVVNTDGETVEITKDTDNVFTDEAGNRIYLDKSGHVVFIDLKRNAVYTDKEGSKLIIQGKSYKFVKNEKSTKNYPIIINPHTEYKKVSSKKLDDDEDFDAYDEQEEEIEEIDEQGNKRIVRVKRVHEPYHQYNKSNPRPSKARDYRSTVPDIQRLKDKIIDEDVLMSEEMPLSDKAEKSARARKQKRIYNAIVASASSVSYLRPGTSGGKQKVKIPIVTPFRSYSFSSLQVINQKQPRYVWVRKHGGQYGVYEPSRTLLGSLQVYNFQDQIWRGKSFKAGTINTHSQLKRLVTPERQQRQPIPPIDTSSLSEEPLSATANLSSIIGKRNPIFIPKVTYSARRAPVTVRNYGVKPRVSPRRHYVLTKSDDRIFEVTPDAPLISIKPLSKEWILKEISKKGTHLI